MDGSIAKSRLLRGEIKPERNRGRFPLIGSLIDPPAGQCSPFAARSGKKPVLTDRSGSPQEKESPEAEEDINPEILCRQCRQGVTDPEQRITVQGGYRHTFANPHGIVFEIGCFREVRNCGVLGSPTDEFSWFSGFRWQVAICGTCLAHLGWLFTGAGPELFFGLILDRLLFPE